MKDLLIDVAGVPTGGGNPDWQRAESRPHAAMRWIVDRLLQSGASVIGKTATDEVSLGILGENPFTGTPLNPAAPDRVPGGSSSGSASAVAAEICDFALGTDTGGSVRVPASFCGLFGIRPTHGSVDFTGVLAQAPGSDTVGWFARDAETFSRVCEAVFGAPPPASLPHRLIVATDTFALADPEVAAALNPMVERLASLLGERRDRILAPQGLSVWQGAQRCLQSSEAWRTFQPWIDNFNPRFAFSVARGLTLGSMITDNERTRAALMRERPTDRIRMLLPAGTILVPADDPVPRAEAGHHLG